MYQQLAGPSLACSLLRAIIARSHLPFFKIFSNFVHLCPNFQIFSPFLTFFCSFSEKSHDMPLLCRISPRQSSNFIFTSQDLQNPTSGVSHFLYVQVCNIHIYLTFMFYIQFDTFSSNSDPGADQAAFKKNSYLAKKEN